MHVLGIYGNLKESSNLGWISLSSHPDVCVSMLNINGLSWLVCLKSDFYIYDAVCAMCPGLVMAMEGT